MTESSIEPTQDPGRRRLVLGLVAVVVAAVTVVLGITLLGGSSGETIHVEVAVGVGERIAAGEQPELLPRTLRVEVGDTLEIVNNDDVAHEVGPYTVGPGQTVRQTFVTPGTIEGLCTLHPDGAITIVVS